MINHLARFCVTIFFVIYVIRPQIFIFTKEIKTILKGIHIGKIYTVIHNEVFKKFKLKKRRRKLLYIAFISRKESS